MKKLLFSLILGLGLISMPFNAEAGNKTKSFLAGSPFYATALFCAYKCATLEHQMTDNYKSLDNPSLIGIKLGFMLTEVIVKTYAKAALYLGGASTSALTGLLISSLTYIYLTKKDEKKDR